MGEMVEAMATTERDFVERYAIRCALGNNGGQWATHYNEDQKNFWRQFVHDLVADIRGQKIEVTEEMVAAGTLCFLKADRRVESLEELLKRVFRVMATPRLWP